MMIVAVGSGGAAWTPVPLGVTLGSVIRPDCTYTLTLTKIISALEGWLYQDTTTLSCTELATYPTLWHVCHLYRGSFSLMTVLLPI